MDYSGEDHGHQGRLLGPEFVWHEPVEIFSLNPFKEAFYPYRPGSDQKYGVKLYNIPVVSTEVKASGKADRVIPQQAPHPYPRFWEISCDFRGRWSILLVIEIFWCYSRRAGVFPCKLKTETNPFFAGLAKSLFVCFSFLFLLIIICG